MKMLPVLLAFLLASATGFSMEVTVHREDLIDPAIPLFANGSSPSWNFSSPMMARIGDEVWFSLSRPVEGVPPYANTVWQVHRRKEEGWEVILESPGPMEREPSPLVALNAYTLAVFTNPKVSFNRFRPENNAILWNSRPHLLAFPSVMKVPETFLIEPEFAGDPVLREHTYRAIAVNPDNSEVFVMVQDPDSELYHPSYLDPMGEWHPLPSPGFPGRCLYANAFIRRREAHLAAVSDIREPVAAWRDAKYKVLQRHWDFAYRNFYYLGSSDLLEEGFREPLLIESVADRPGHLRNLDLLVDDDGTVHLLYRKIHIQYGFLRDEFFPGEPMAVSIVYVRVRNDEIEEKHELVRGLMEPDLSSSIERKTVDWGRLHRLEDGSLIALVTGFESGRPFTRLLPLGPDGRPGPALEVPLQSPMSSVFFTNTERGGSRPSNRIDLLEMTWGKTHHQVRYAEIEVGP